MDRVVVEAVVVISPSLTYGGATGRYIIDKKIIIQRGKVCRSPVDPDLDHGDPVKGGIEILVQHVAAQRGETDGIRGSLGENGKT